MPVASAQFTAVYGRPNVTKRFQPFNGEINAICVDAFPALDINVDSKKLQTVRDFMKASAINFGNKKTAKFADYKNLIHDIDAEMGGEKPHYSAGGTGANFAAGLKALLGAQAKVFFMGIVSKNESTPDARKKSRFMRESFKLAGVKLCLPLVKTWDVIESVVAWGTNEDGHKDRAIIKQESDKSPATFLSRANLVKMKAERYLKKANLIFLPGNMIGRAHEMHDLVLDHYMSGGKVLAFAGPTDYKMAMEHQHEIEHILRYTDIAMFNAEEAMAAFGTDPDKLPKIPGIDKVDPVQRAAILNGTLKKMVDVFHSTPPRSWKRYREGQVGVVTDGGQGIYIVTGKGWVHYDSVPVVPVNTVGAGDICFSSFVAAFMRGCSLEMCAAIAQTAASEKLKVNAARLLDVLKHLPQKLAKPFLSPGTRRGSPFIPRGAKSALKVA